jgi:hypothetical protein
MQSAHDAATAAALHDAFQSHCATTTASAAAARHPALVRLAVWPMAATLADVTRDAGDAAVALDFTLLDTCLSQAAAAEVAISGRGDGGGGNGLLRPPAWLPAPALAACLGRGGAADGSGDADGAIEGFLRLAWAAAGVFAERAGGSDDVAQRAAWAARLASELKVWYTCHTMN